MGREIVARAVGRDRRVRVLRVAPLTARLLHQYGETACKSADPAGLSLAEHRRLVATAESDPDALPLFLTARRSALRPATYRDRAWRPACAAGLALEPRDARRWYAAQTTHLIRETAPGPAAGALRDLAAYLRGVRDRGSAPDILAATAATAAHARVQDRSMPRLGDDLGHALMTAFSDRWPASHRSRRWCSSAAECCAPSASVTARRSSPPCSLRGGANVRHRVLRRDGKSAAEAD